MSEDRQFYVGQKAVIAKGSEVLLLHHPVPAPGNNDLPGGKIQVGETDFIEALKREVLEETNLKITVGRPFFTNYWEFPADSNHRNRGKQIYLVFFACTYASGEVKISHEHDWFKWVDRANFASNFARQNNVFQALDIYFREIAKG
jgi:8-oxo-dGTP pyrophosphatase MutT (NUDIX family)